MQQYNLVLSGLGGQGVMTISRVLAAAAHREQVPVRLFEGTGISQRGGGVYAFFRFGRTHSPKVPAGRGDAILGLEMSEVASVIYNLKPEGRIWLNSGAIHGFFDKLDPSLYPSRERLEALMRQRTSRYTLLPATDLARAAGSVQAVNMVMLGAFCRGTDLLPREAVTWAIESVNPKWAAANLAAFEKGFGFDGQAGS